MTTVEQADLEDLPDASGAVHGGLDALRQALPTLPAGPGVYRMLDSDGGVLYVGKARSLKRRVTSYTQLARLPIRLQRMVSQTSALEVVTTHTEAEALLLESNLIKRLAPRYNVLLRDDKSFPYILLTSQLNRKIQKTGAAPQKQRRRPKDDARPRFKAPDQTRSIGSGSPNTGVRAPPRVSISAPSHRAAQSTARSMRSSGRSCCAVVPTRYFQGAHAPASNTSSNAAAVPASAILRRTIMASWSDKRATSSAANRVKSRKAWQQPCNRRAATSNSKPPAGSATVSAALTQIQAHQDINVENLKLPEADVIAAWQMVGQTCHPGLLFSRRAQLRQPRLLSAARQIGRRERGAHRIHRPILRRQVAAARGTAQPPGARTRSFVGGADGARPTAKWSLPIRFAGRGASWCSTPLTMPAMPCNAGWRKRRLTRNCWKSCRTVQPGGAAEPHRGLRQLTRRRSARDRRHDRRRPWTDSSRAPTASST